MNLPPLHDQLADRARPPLVWSEPSQFSTSSLADSAEIQRKLDQGSGVLDSSRIIAEELQDMMNHRVFDSDEERDQAEQYVDHVLSLGSSPNWFYFPWSNNLVSYAEEGNHWDLITYRNMNLVTRAEQLELRRKSILIGGLSVGESVAMSLAHSGIGSRYYLADLDTTSVTNLNRKHSGMPQVGMRKVDDTAIKFSELNPYVSLKLYPEGVDDETLNEVARNGCDLVFDELDNIAVKAMMRRWAQDQGVPLIMATDLDETAIIDVELYGIDKKAAPFMGRLSEAEIDRLVSGPLSEDERNQIMKKLVGAKSVTPRMLGSVSEMGKTISGMPQLGTTSQIAGGLAANVARDVLLGRLRRSSSRPVKARSVLGLRRKDSILDSVQMVKQFRQSRQNT